MEIKIKAVGVPTPDWYEFEGDVITVHVGDVVDSYDFTNMPNGAFLTDAEPVNGVTCIRDAIREEDGTLKVTLVQRVGDGHWEESDWMDSSEYDPDGINVVFIKSGGTIPTCYTRSGKVSPEGY